MSQKLLSAAVMIGALRVNPSFKIMQYALFHCLPSMYLGVTTVQRYILAWKFVTRSCLKLQNPCLNHEIHVLFEHGFYLKKP